MPIASRGRVAVIASLAIAVAFTSGCSWFRKDNDAYKLSGEARPLEIPPELDRPSADAAIATSAELAGAGECRSVRVATGPAAGARLVDPAGRK